MWRIRCEGRSGGRSAIHARLQHTIEELIADDVVRRSTRRPIGRSLRRLAVKRVASTFVIVLNWWLDMAGARSQRDADALFRALVMPVFAV